MSKDLYENGLAPNLVVAEEPVGRYTGLVDQHGDRVFVTRQPIGFTPSQRNGYTVVRGEWDVEGRS